MEFNPNFTYMLQSATAKDYIIERTVLFKWKNCVVFFIWLLIMLKSVKI
jgi:hypothetical protein